MGKLVLGGVLLLAAFFVMVGRGALSPKERPRPVGALVRLVAFMFTIAGLVIGSTIVIIEPGQVGVRHAFGFVDPKTLLPGVRFVSSWSEVER
jgi:hypothetical protein